MIEQLLKQLNFNEKEIKIYLTLLSHGKLEATEVSRLTGINRTTVYSIAKELIKKRVVIEDIGSINKLLVAKNPQELRRIISNQEEALIKSKSVVEQAIFELGKLQPKLAASLPKVVFIPEEDLEKYLYERSDLWCKSIMASDGIWWGFQDPTFVELFKDWIDWFWEKSAPQNLKLQLLTSKSKEESKLEKKYDRRIIKFWSKNNSKFTASTWVNGDYIIMIITNNHPFYLIEIHDSTLAHNLREMYKGIWEDQK